MVVIHKLKNEARGYGQVMVACKGSRWIDYDIEASWLWKKVTCKRCLKLKTK